MKKAKTIKTNISNSIVTKGLQDNLFSEYNSITKDYLILIDRMAKRKQDNHLRMMNISLENDLRILDAALDIFKFTVPIIVTIWLSLITIPQLVSSKSDWVLYVLVFLLIGLFVTFVIRACRVSSYVSDFKAQNNELEELSNVGVELLRTMTNAKRERLHNKFETYLKKFEAYAKK